MEAVDSLNVWLNNLRDQARKLTSTALNLITLFAEESERLGREDEVSRLKASLHTIRQQAEMVKWNEDSASYSHSKSGIVLSLSGLAAFGIGMVSKNKPISAFAQSLLESTQNNDSSFGNICICVGSEGLPADVKVVSVSRLARESKRQKFEVEQELQGQGFLLFTEEAFSVLIDRLVKDIREGRLSLPVSRDTLLKIMAPKQANLRLKKME